MLVWLFPGLVILFIKLISSIICFTDILPISIPLGLLPKKKDGYYNNHCNNFSINNNSNISNNISINNNSTINNIHTIYTQTPHRRIPIHLFIGMGELTLLCCAIGMLLLYK